MYRIGYSSVQTHVGKREQKKNGNKMDGNEYDAQVVTKDVEDEDPDGRINPPIIPA